jgi:hypothetical protein
MPQATGPLPEPPPVVPGSVVPGDHAEIDKFLSLVARIKKSIRLAAKELHFFLRQEHLPAKLRDTFSGRLTAELDALWRLLLEASVALERCVSADHRGVLDTWIRSCAGLTGVLSVQVLQRQVDPGTASSWAETLKASARVWNPVVSILCLAKVEKGPRLSKKQRRCYRRDHKFLQWKRQGLTPAKIRDRWNTKHQDRPKDQIEDGEKGIDIVKKGIRKALREEKKP